ncbi:MAG: REP-associated tyrosine transposase [Verrucomicrobiales bacterium]
MSSTDHSLQFWPHAPPHWLFQSGIYFVTASTYHREKIFTGSDLLDVVTRHLVESAVEHGWSLKAWAVLANHYHFLAESPAGSGISLGPWLRTFHCRSATEANRLSGTPGRRVWMNYRETRITHQTSYLARIRYVNENPVHHGLVRSPLSYPWCSATWFERNAPRSFVESVARFKTNRINVWDEF